MPFLQTWISDHPLFQGKKALLLLAVLGTAFSLGTLVGAYPLLVVGGSLAVMGLLLILAKPDSATLLVVFILYSNTAVIAVQFHGLPFILGAATPLLLFAPLISYLIIQRQKLIITPITLSLLIFLFAHIISTLFSRYVEEATAILINFLVEGIGIYLLFTNVVRTRTVLRGTIWTLLLAGALMGGLSLYQQLSGTYANNYGGFAQVSNAAFRTGIEQIDGEVEQPRLAGPVGEQNRYAQVLLMLVPLGLFRFWGERSTILRLLALGATALIAIGVVLTFSLGAAVGFVLMFLLMSVLGFFKLRQIAIIILGVFLLFLAVPQYGVRMLRLQEVSSMFVNSDGPGVAGTDGSTQSRITQMITAAQIFAEHPVIGVGPGVYRYYYLDYAKFVGIRAHQTHRQAHNLYLGLAAELGLVGLISFLGVVALTLSKLVRVRNKYAQTDPDMAHMATGFMLAIIAYMATGIFLHFAYIRFFWLMLALASAASYIADAQAAHEGSV
jgi:putative inorganic carbon (hco3(-)) transporter